MDKKSINPLPHLQHQNQPFNMNRIFEIKSEWSEGNAEAQE